MKTVLITGCSSGFGLEIARHFLNHDWQVMADTRFSETARAFSAWQGHEGYAELMQSTFARMRAVSSPASSTTDVASAVLRAATDVPCPLHVPAGVDAVAWAAEAAV